MARLLLILPDFRDLSEPVAERFIQFSKQNCLRVAKAKRETGGLQKLTDPEVVAFSGPRGKTPIYNAACEARSGAIRGELKLGG